MKKIHVTTLGCSKNIVDSEKLMGQLEIHQFDMCEQPAEADVIIVNTCGFITDAKEESIQAIWEALRLKEDDPAKKVFVAGCLSQRYRAEIEKEMPEVDAVFGTEDYQSILKELGQNHAAVDNLLRMRRFTTPRHYAYLKISEGCNHTCAFCAIPGIRGKHRSRSIESLVEEAQRLSQGGAREIILVSQDSSYYGKDLYGKQMIVDLLNRLNDIETIDWLRVMYWYPTNFPQEVLSLMAGDHKLLPYIDMPIQHISERVLRLMRRGDTRTSIRRLMDKMRTVVPQATLRSTLILGHPGEKDEDFKELLQFVEEARFDRLGTFTYSDEEGTSAYSNKDKVDQHVAGKRQEHIMSVQREISLESNRKWIDSGIRVMIDEYDHYNNMLIGRTYRDAPEIDNIVYVKTANGRAPDPGSIVDVYIEDASEYELYGFLIG
ncbi:MAG: 30S ribosomal protein S12 methylthiotransferase RimO [Caldithrix sp.]|nr:30S ribosomal protein S12 methylthiotransferase RimO [Caldithrix sp.]